MADRAEASQGEKDLVERVVGVGDPMAVGRFRYWFRARQWEWSAEVARMHGHPPDTQPTTELLLSHKHPDDRDRLEAMIVSVEDGGAFSSRHRIIDTAGRTHEVLVVSEPMADAHGTVTGTQGYYIDLSAAANEYRNEAIEDVLPQLVDARAVIEQAKGALMLAYGISADHAFAVLRWRSQETNTKLRALAHRLMANLRDVTGDEVQLRSRMDHLLLTAHHGLDPEPAD
ncbi:PAS and ANTAR domain-containing protein [Nocardia blacklockiae]|uniref:PAS and ANTAR domain-containing protein n=1 Tax=Nocardia blacklockiae TaxID=480036 RepID=UPI00189568FA|nr:PAS and ANTAR domain-containing protein [Nocardia blacklockiae]MBF6174974.1 PAS and ANTAR domain-containing protein [Nocardia blacklockiae]